jgi:UPF0716 protein FxsA
VTIAVYKILILIFAFLWLEFYVLVQVGVALGAWVAVLLAIMTTLLGASIIRYQFALISARIDQYGGTIKDYPFRDSMTITFQLISSFLLLLPGFITDFIGLLLLIPLVRNRVILWATRYHSTAKEPKNITIEM